MEEEDGGKGRGLVGQEFIGFIEGDRGSVEKPKPKLRGETGGKKQGTVLNVGGGGGMGKVKQEFKEGSSARRESDVEDGERGGEAEMLGESDNAIRDSDEEVMRDGGAVGGSVMHGCRGRAVKVGRGRSVGGFGLSRGGDGEEG